MRAVFVDTSAFVALIDRADRNHSAAKRCLRRLAHIRRPLVTSTYVIDETLTLIRMDLGHSTAVAFGNRLRETRWCQVIEVGEATHASAWGILVRYDDQLFSFTDCTSFALMRAADIDTAFTFDRRDFSAAGFAVIPPAVTRIPRD